MSAVKTTMSRIGDSLCIMVQTTIGVKLVLFLVTTGGSEVVLAILIIDDSFLDCPWVKRGVVQILE